MAITIDKQPDFLVPAGNRVELKLSKTSLYAGTFFYLRITFNNLETIGKIIKLSYAGNSQTWSVVANVTDPTTQILDSTGLTLSEWVEDYVLPSLRSKKEISDLYFINYHLNGTFNTIVFIAKEKSNSEDITVHGDTTFNFSSSTVSGTNPSTVINNRININIYKEDLDNIYENLVPPYSYFKSKSLIGSESLICDDNNSCLFDISEYLYTNLGTSFSFDDIFRSVNEHCQKYYIEYFESSGIPATYQALYLIENLYAFYGQYSKEFISTLNSNNDKISNYYRRPLNWLPENKKIPASSRIEFYSIINYDPEPEINATIKVYYTDDTNEDVIEFQLTSTERKTYQFRFDIPYILSQSNQEKTVKYFVFMLYGLGTGISQTTTYYYIDYDYENLPEQYAILFRNSLGAYDTIYLRGNNAKYADYIREEIQTILPEDYLPTDGEISTYNTQEVISRLLNTGYVSDEELDSFRDLLISEEIYLIDRIDASFNIYKISNLTTSVNLSETNNFLNNIPFKCKLSNIENAYSKNLNYNSYVNLALNGSLAYNLDLWNISLDGGGYPSWIFNSGYAVYNGSDEGGYISQDILALTETFRIQVEEVLWSSNPTGEGYIKIFAGTTESSNLITDESTNTIDIQLTCAGNTTLKIFALHASGTYSLRGIKVYKVS